MKRSKVQPTQSTPGPWKVTSHTGQPRVKFITHEISTMDGGRIALVAGAVEAALIAASPELRDALSVLLEGLDPYDSERGSPLRDAQALLTKLRNAGA
ncbi:MAG TPA: hypothetical protein ENI27_00975 [bacterium]|nr:hypothetical protein [bacterium]